MGHDPRCRRYCFVCGKRFFSVRRDRKDCSDRCRKKRNRADAKGEPLKAHAKYVEA